MKILNKIALVIMSAAVFPALFMRVLLRAVVSINKDSTVYSLLSLVAKDTINKKMEITVTIKEIVGYIQNGTFSFGGMDFSFKKLPSELLVTKNWLIATAAAVIIALIIALVIMGCALFTNANRTVIGLSAGGIACCIAAIKFFSRFSRPFTDGSIDIGGLLAKSFIGEETGIIASLGKIALNDAITVDIFQLGNAVFTMLIVFVIILVWSFSYFITLDPKQKKKKAN